MPKTKTDKFMLGAFIAVLVFIYVSLYVAT